MFSLANIIKILWGHSCINCTVFIVWHQSSWVVGIHPLFIYIACSIKIKIYLKHWQCVFFSSFCFSMCLISIFRYHSTIVCPSCSATYPIVFHEIFSVTYIYSCINMTNKKIQEKNLTHCVKNSMTTVVVLECAKLIQCRFSPIT